MENFFPPSVSVGFAISGITGIFAAPLLAFIWCKRPHARLFPFFVGCLAYVLMSFIRQPLFALIPSSSTALGCLPMSLVTGIVGEGGKVIVFLFVLERYDRREDAVSYGIGHALLENLVTGIKAIPHRAGGKYASRCADKPTGVLCAVSP